jgi:Lar family restriction alleviation protein
MKFCPFCGSETVSLSHAHNEATGAKSAFYVECHECEATGPMAHIGDRVWTESDQAHATGLWNDRLGERAHSALVKRQTLMVAVRLMCPHCDGRYETSGWERAAIADPEDGSMLHVNSGAAGLRHFCAAAPIHRAIQELR